MKYPLRTALASAMAALSFGQAQAVPVALELALVIDVSGSISATEYALQRTGYVNAFSDPTIQANILSYAPSGGVAVAVYQFSTDAAVAINWVQIDSAGDLASFIASLGTMARLSSGSTDVSDGIDIGRTGIQTNGFEGARLVMDVSGDGEDNVGGVAGVIASRNATSAAGITINGLPIGSASLTTYYNANVKTASGFVVAANTFADFESAVKTKIGREIIGGDDPIPAPGIAWLLGAGLIAVGGKMRAKKRAA